MRCLLPLLWMLILLPAAAPAAFAQQGIPQTITYQGYLTNTDGDPADGSATVVFSLYSSATNSVRLWQETQQGVVFTDGVFSVHLGSVESLAEVPFDAPLWLGLSVAGSQELAPRVALEAVPFALSVRGLRTLPGEDPDFDPVPNVVLGFEENGVEEGVSGAVISGGGGTDFAANEVSASYGTVGGGHTNTVTGFGGTVSGGGGNEAEEFSAIGGGSSNRAEAEFSTIGGGISNRTAGNGSTVGGGGANRAEGVSATISGGENNLAEGDNAVISGGENNIASNDGATIGGGRNNEALGCYDTVAGGDGNRAQADDFGAAFKGVGRSCSATVGGGRDNVATDDGATVAGGVNNTASASSAAVGGGFNNKASGDRATVPGGERNQARGENSLAAGTEARAAHEGTFVWSDNASSDSLVSTADHQFLIRARGGVGIGTDAPEGALHVTNTESVRDLVLGGTDNSLFGDDGVISSDPAFDSSDLWLVSNDAVAVFLDADESGETAEFIVADADLDAVFQVDLSGTVATGQIELDNELGTDDTPAEGGVYRDNVVYAWAQVLGDGTVTASYGCTVSKSATGSYTVTFKRQLPNGVSAIVTPQTLNDPVIATATANANQVQVVTRFFNGASFVAGDYGFYVQVVGRP